MRYAPLPPPPETHVQVGVKLLVNAMSFTTGCPGGVTSITIDFVPLTDQLPAASRSCRYKVCDPVARLTVGTCKNAMLSIVSIVNTWSYSLKRKAPIPSTELHVHCGLRSLVGAVATCSFSSICIAYPFAQLFFFISELKTVL